MNVRPHLIAGSVLLLTTSAAQAATGLSWIDANTNLTLYGDIRLRYEVDWDSQNSAGVARDDRHRGRVRARAGFNYQLADEWAVGARVRTGNSRSQQSPHLTFVADDDLRDDLDFVLDRYFVQYKGGGVSAWAGRNLSPFWQQTELFWDEDVTPTGAAGSYDARLGTGSLSFIGGAFYLPDGGYDLNGQMLAGQVKHVQPIRNSQLTAAAGLFFMNGASGANNLRNRNGDRDYLVGALGVQWSVPLGKIPVTLGADVFNNFQDYDAADVAPFSASTEDETFGYVLSASIGQMKKQHDWLVGYYWAHIETLSVNASYAQDDWVRFGNGPQTDGTDFEGHELRVGYVVSKNINLLARLYVVEAITSVQDGNRFRLDLNWKF